MSICFSARSVIAGEYAQLLPWIEPTAAEQRRMQETTSAHPLTWVVSAAPGTPQWLTGGRDTIAVRLTDHPEVSELCRLTNSSLVSTSANRSGHRPAMTALQARSWLGAQVDFVVNAPLGGASGPSEIRRAADGAVIRRAVDDP